MSSSYTKAINLLHVTKKYLLMQKHTVTGGTSEPAESAKILIRIYR